MKVILAPMEGVADAAMRQALTACGGYDLVITEFVRVVDQLLPERTYYRYCDELKNDGFTPDGTPVRIQLLGQHPEFMALNALRAIELGSHGLDINFGCPSKTVNNSKGGAIMLKDPESIYQVIKAVREAVPNKHVVSAKIRLGWEDKNDCVAIAQAVEEAGASELTIHARSKVDGYQPPAHWHYIDKVRQRVSLPITANGEVWGREDYQACRMASGCDNVMIGRGALTIPNLANVVKGIEGPMPWEQTKELLVRFSEHGAIGLPRYRVNRIKQWLRYMSRHYTEAQDAFINIRTLRDYEQVKALIRAS